MIKNIVFKIEILKRICLRLAGIWILMNRSVSLDLMIDTTNLYHLMSRSQSYEKARIYAVILVQSDMK